MELLDQDVELGGERRRLVDELLQRAQHLGDGRRDRLGHRAQRPAADRPHEAGHGAGQRPAQILLVERHALAA